MQRILALLVAGALSLAPALAAEPPFLKPGRLDLTALLAPPPADDSPQTRQEIDELIRIQAAASPERIALARADVEETVFRFASAVGDGFAPAKLPVTAAFFERVGETEGLFTDPAKDAWKRTRPFILTDSVKALVRPSRSGSYPSGHSTRGTMMAVVLAQMLPEKAADIFARARDYGFSREVGGMHYASDVEAGRIAGTVIAQALLEDEEFRAEFARARTELRTVLALAP